MMIQSSSSEFSRTMVRRARRMVRRLVRGSSISSCCWRLGSGFCSFSGLGSSLAFFAAAAFFWGAFFWGAAFLEGSGLGAGASSGSSSSAADRMSRYLN